MRINARPISRASRTPSGPISRRQSCYATKRRLPFTCFDSRTLVRSLLAIAIALLWLAQSPPARATPTDWHVASANSSSTHSGSQWAVANAFDGNPSTVWGSATHPTAQNPEWIQFHLDASHRVNYVKLTTRFDGTSALGFPFEFVISWANGSTWQTARGYTHYARPTTQTLTFTLPAMVNTAGLMISVKVLGDDKVGNYVFQLAEVGAGYDPDLGGIDYTPTDDANGVHTSSALWPATNTADGDPGTSWSSSTHAGAANSEWIAYWWAQGFKPINYIKVLPRYASTQTSNNPALGFPTQFSVYYSNGSSWVLLRTYTNFPTPTRGDWIILPFSTISANGLRITATTLGGDGAGNFVFQLAEVRAGYNALFDSWQVVGNDGTANRIEIQGISSESVDRTDQLGNWNRDEVSPLIVPNPGNHSDIYAPFAIKTGSTSWNVYYGGLDGTSVWGDQLYETNTNDNFITLGARSFAVTNVEPNFHDVNNDCPLYVGPNDWRMVYTVVGTSTTEGKNRPAYSTSTDGVHWTPSKPDTAHLLNMTGYSTWATTANVNGGNVIFRDATGVWHLYFDDIDTAAQQGIIHHATSSDFVNYTYIGDITPSTPVIMNDFKSFNYGGTTYYVGSYMYNGPSAYLTVNTRLDSIPTVDAIFTNPDVAHCNLSNSTAGLCAESAIVSTSLVQDGSRIYGMLYGAGAGFTDISIFVRWLQKKVSFLNTSLSSVWGDPELAAGPDKIHIGMTNGDTVETGQFYVYDTDGTTLLYVSPPVTMRAGDVWKYVPGN